MAVDGHLNLHQRFMVDAPCNPLPEKMHYEIQGCRPLLSVYCPQYNPCSLPDPSKC